MIDALHHVAQTISTFNKIKAALAKPAYSMSDIVKLAVFVAGDPKLGGKMAFAGFNAGYKAFFGTPENPNLVAHSTVQVAALARPELPDRDRGDRSQGQVTDHGRTTILIIMSCVLRT